jgi:hypothetical protein
MAQGIGRSSRDGERAAAEENVKVLTSLGFTQHLRWAGLTDYWP